METGDLWKLILLFFCLVLSAFFSASETAFIAFPRVRLIHLVKTGRHGVGRVSHLLERPEKLLSTVLLGNNLVNTGAAALATALAISLIENENLAVLAATIGVTLLLLVFAETLPKTLAWGRAESVAFAVSGPLVLVGWALFPAVRLLQALSSLAGKALGTSPIHSHVTEEEIRTMISVGAQAGAMKPREAEMLEKVFHFGDRQVQEIMTPRTEIIWVEKNATLEEFFGIYSQEAHTRFPLFEGDVENVVGILFIKDLLQGMAQGELHPGSSVSEVQRPAYFVPETKLVGQLFSELRQAGQQMAIVIDQYGGVAGLVTLKRLVEVIVGPEGEEGEPAKEEFEAIGENVYEVDAGIAVQKANDELGLELPEGNYQTLAGFVLERLGRIPEEGDHLSYQDLRFEVTEMRRVKIERVRIQRIAKPAEQKES